MSIHFQKPVLTDDAIMQFAAGAAQPDTSVANKSSAASAADGTKSGLVPVGDVRLTANIRSDLHMRLKVRAAQERTTIGELIERWVEGWDK